MVVPLSKLQDLIILETVKAVENARFRLQFEKFIQTESPEISFSIDVVLDTLPQIEVDGDVTESPEQTTTATKESEKSTQTQKAVTTTEKQTTTPGKESSEQTYGRSTITETEEVT